MKKVIVCFVLTILVLVVFFSILLPGLIPANAAGPRPGDKVVLAEGAVGYRDPSCTGKEGEKLRRNDGVYYYGNCMKCEWYWTDGIIRRHLNPWFGWKYNNMIRVCQGDWPYHCQWFDSKSVMFPAHP